MTLLDKALVRMLPVVPKPVVQLFSSRYIAGTTLDEAIEVVRALNRDGKLATIKRARRSRSSPCATAPSNHQDP